MKFWNFKIMWSSQKLGHTKKKGKKIKIIELIRYLELKYVDLVT